MALDWRMKCDGYTEVPLPLTTSCWRRPGELFARLRVSTRRCSYVIVIGLTATPPRALTVSVIGLLWLFSVTFR